MHRLRDRDDKWQPFMVGETVDGTIENAQTAIAGPAQDGEGG
jgi:hypothetical protein